MASVSFENVGKLYPNGTRAVSDLSLEVGDGQFTVLVGPSGCGKTTALRMVAGLEDVSEGEVKIGGHAVNELEPQKRDVAMVFQNYALYPHMTVFENIAFPLRSRRTPRDEITQRVERVAHILGLEDLLKRHPRTLSGGQRQRVAMGRAIVREPQVFLMDEPLSNLDTKLRGQMRAEIATLQRELGVTTIYVTHDQVEALTMGTRIAVMRKGVLQQHDSPAVIYDRPGNLFVATFIGAPPMNLLQAHVRRARDQVECVLDGVGESVRLPAVALVGYDGRAVAAGIRPEHVVPVAEADSEVLTLPGLVTLVEPLGSENHVHIEMNAVPVVTDEILEIAQDTDAATLKSLRDDAREHKTTIVARLAREVVVERGDRIAFGVRPQNIHFFDLETGEAIR